MVNDVAYHANKIDRKFDNLINILGADHTGERIKATVSALSNKKVNLDCKVCQLVKLFMMDSHSRCPKEQEILFQYKIY